MQAQTLLNGFLSYERRYGLNRLYEYATSNFRGSIGNPKADLWQVAACSSNDYGLNYEDARNNSSANDGFGWETAVRWLDSYLSCVQNLPGNPYLAQRVQRAFDHTIMPQINAAAYDFYNFTEYDPTNAAYGTVHLNFGDGRAQYVCVGGCYINGDTNNIVYRYEAQDRFLGFATSFDNIAQSDIYDAYELHTQQIASYVPSYDSVVQPVQRTDRNLASHEPVGYRWLTTVLQRALDMRHAPR